MVPWRSTVIQYVCVMLRILYRKNGREFVPNYIMRRYIHVGVITGYITPDQSAALEKCVAAWEGGGRGGVTHPIDWEPVIASHPTSKSCKSRTHAAVLTLLGLVHRCGMLMGIDRMSWLLMYVPLVQTRLWFQPVSTACGCGESLSRDNMQIRM